MKGNLSKGKTAEKKAVVHLEKNNYRIIHTNWRCRLGEADIIAFQGSVLCFIEVKYRSSDIYGTPGEAVDFRKQKKIIDIARAYISGRNITGKDVRFDVVEVTDSRVNIIKNAFTADIQ
ncbi:MAG: YraN family protein [Elusimicrobiota bacterium]